MEWIHSPRGIMSLGGGIRAKKRTGVDVEDANVLVFVASDQQRHCRMRRQAVDLGGRGTICRVSISMKKLKTRIEYSP